MEEDGTCKLVTMAEYLGVTDRTVRKRITEFNDEYEIKDSVISRKIAE